MIEKIKGNKSILRSESTKSMLVILGVVFFSVFLLPLVQSLEIDNWKYYDEEKREYLITNAFGQGEDIAKVKLTSELNVLVPRGYQKVAEFTVENYDDYVNVFNDMEFYDLNKDNELFTRDFDYKYKTIVQVPEYKTICDKGLNENGTIGNINCRAEQIGLQDKIVWEEINKVDGLLKGNITIGIFTNVKKGDNVEWIPTLFGERLTKWSVWTESLNVDLVACYKLDGLSGDVKDSQGNNNGTNNGATRGAIGILNFSFDFENDDSDYVNLTDMDELSGVDEFSVSVWVNPEVMQTTDIIIGQLTAAETDAAFLIRLFASGLVDFLVWNTGGTNSQINNLVVVAGEWSHIVATYNGSSTRLYVNNTLSASGTLTGNVRNSAQNVTLGTRNDLGVFYDGLMDEVFIWNRSLSVSEVSDLYNDAAAITCTKVFLPTITLNSPINAFNTTNTTINFNGTVSDSPVNVTLFIDGILNETNSSGIDAVDYLFTKVVSEGDHNWTYESCNNNGCTIATTRTFTIDATVPSLNITEPFGVINFQDISENQTLRWNVSDPNIDTCLLQYEEVNITLDCSTNISNFSIGTTRTLDIFANDTLGNIVSDTVTWSYSVLQTSSTFNASSFETAEERFTVNVTTNGSVITVGSLTFDGTENTGATITNTTTNNYSITKAITIPTSIGSKSFSFNLTLGGTIVNTTIQTQIINATNFTICGSSPLNVPYINFSFKNETLSQEDVNATISSTWTYSLTELSEVNKTLIFTDATQKLNYTFCFAPSDRTVNIDLTMTYNNDI
ncbi:hypothetical protein LCGC14_1914450, partial [marine sediment metagenome]